MGVVLGLALLSLPLWVQARDGGLSRLLWGRRAPAPREKPLRQFASYSQLARALKQAQFSNAYGGLDRRVSLALGQADVSMAEVLPAAAAAADAVAEDGTGTNNQVAGVDEADIVKTDGTYLYTISNGRLAVVRGAQALPDGTVQPLELVSLVPFDDDGFIPSELHLYGHFLVVVGMSYDYSFLTDPVVSDPVVTYGAKMACLMPVWGGTARVVLRVYDVADPRAVSLVRTVQMEGTQLSSRRIGQYLYILARAYPRLDAAYETLRASVTTGLVPRVEDSLDGEGFRALLPREITPLPDCFEASYLVVGALDLGSATGEFKTQAFLGAGNVVYVSPENLYVAASSWFWRPMLMIAAAKEAEISQETVRLFRFRLAGLSVQLAAQGTVPGRVLNSFSMDESDGVFRIATTAYPDVWTEAGQTSGVYTFDLALNPLGKVTGLAPGERIYAARFLGERCYLVTFETVDPLFVIDLADPAKPQVLGELKVPGYSSYLHPFDDTHLIGLGKDVQMVQTPWSDSAGVPLEQGLKVALYDVRDVAHPLELYAEYLGVRGSYSEALYDHHAFLFDQKRGLLAFPCTIREFIDPPDPADPWWWGDFVFQGLVAYGLSLENGFERLGAVTHLDGQPDDLWDAPWDCTVRRGLVVGGLLHSVSERIIKANDSATMAEVSALKLPWEETPVEDPLVYCLTTDATATDSEGGSADGDAAGLLDTTSAASSEPAAAVGELLRGYLEATR
jgi:inhibitor of cysteine peptidase